MSHELGKRYLVVLGNCADPEREDEFDRWYTEVHAPDVTKNGNFTRFTRFKLVGRLREGQARYLVLYEIESDEDVRAINEHLMAENTKLDPARGAQGLFQGVGTGYYEFISEATLEEVAGHVTGQDALLR